MKKRDVKALLIIVVLVVTLAGCESLNSAISILKGELVGNDYTVKEYDNFGTEVLTLHGSKIKLSEGKDNNGNASSYIDITVDGYEWNHVGNTLVFYQNGVDLITDFQIPTEIESIGTSTGLMGVDKVINNYQNIIGKKSVVVIFSQTGAPIALLQGDSCYTSTPSDLPKTTQLSIDGKLVYIHRANVDIFPAALFGN